MNLPAPVTAALGDEEVAARVQLKGEDALFVTPTRTLVYHGEGLLSDESVEEFPHDAERIEVSSGRRKAKIRLDCGLDGVREFAVPPASLEEALHPVLAGVLNAAGVTEPGETVTRTFRFSELTLVVTSHRVVKHVGAAVWDEEYEEIRYEDVTGLAVEEGNVASQLVIDTSGRSQRIKVPNRQARVVRERIEEALFAFHDVATLEEFAELVGDEEDLPAEPADRPAATSFESDLDPIDLSDPDEDADPTTAGWASDGPPAGEPAADQPTTGDGSAAGAGPTAVDAGRDGAAPSATGRSALSPEGAESGATDPGPAETTDPGSADAGPAAPESADRDPGGPDGFAEFETAVAEPADVGAELAALRRAVEHQRDLLARQAALIEDIAAELDGEE